MKNKKRSEQHKEVSPREGSLSSMTEDVVSINSPKWNYICGTKNQPWSQIEKEGTSKDLQYISLRMYRETKGLQPTASARQSTGGLHKVHSQENITLVLQESGVEVRPLPWPPNQGAPKRENWEALKRGTVVENSLQGIPQLLLLLSRFSRVQLCATPWTTAYQALPSMEFSRQEYWSGLPLPSPEFLSSPVVKTLRSHCWGSQFNPWSEN